MEREKPRKTYRYGDFPELFWDARKSEVIDVTELVTLGRILTRANAKTVALLVPREILEAKLELLSIPEHSKFFWRRVIANLPPRTASNNEP
ncbi:MAG: hypothetical protein ACRENP_06275 [Longimicrobiales bacterium]